MRPTGQNGGRSHEDRRWCRRREEARPPAPPPHGGSHQGSAHRCLGLRRAKSNVAHPDLAKQAGIPLGALTGKLAGSRQRVTIDRVLRAAEGRESASPGPALAGHRIDLGDAPLVLWRREMSHHKTTRPQPKPRSHGGGAGNRKHTVSPAKTHIPARIRTSARRGPNRLEPKRTGQNRKPTRGSTPSRLRSLRASGRLLAPSVGTWSRSSRASLRAVASLAP